MKHIIIFILALLLLPGCGIYKQYSRPEVHTETIMGDAQVLGDTTTIATISWYDFFTDPDLRLLIEIALERNTDLQIAHLRVEQASALLRSAKLTYLPSVALTPEGGISSFDGGKAEKTYNLAASASWEIDIFGRITNAKRQARASLQQTLAYEQAVQTNLVATLANSYYSLLMLDRQMEITRLTLENWEKTIRVLSALKKSGEANQVAVSQAEANKLVVEASLLSMEKEIREIENAMCMLLGIAVTEIPRGKMEEQQFPEELSVGVPLQLLANRPDIRQAEFALQQAYYATNEARSAFYPSVTLSGSAGWTNNAGVILNPGNWLLSAVGSVVQPVFTQGRNKANLKIAKAAQQEALLEFQQALFEAGAEVNNSLVQWQTARQRQHLDRRQIELLENTVRNTRLLMQYSEVNYLEVLIAQQTLLDARLTEVADRFDEIQGVINLYHALGGGKE